MILLCRYVRFRGAVGVGTLEIGYQGAGGGTGALGLPLC